MLFTFAKPTYLFLLAVVPVLIFIHFLTLKWKRSQALTFANFEAIARVKGIDLLSKNIFVLIMTMLVSALLVLSLTGLTLHRLLPSSEFSYAIAIDTSRSMEATDFTPSRIEAAKHAALEFVDITPIGTQMAVLSFSGNAFIEQQLTPDKELVKESINAILLSAVGGTDLNEAVTTSTLLLNEEEAKSVIIISDGRLTVGSIQEVIDYAIENDIIIHTVAIGTPEGGTTSYGVSKLDEDTLQAAAYNTGGQYFRAEDQSSLTETMNTIITLKTKRVAINLTQYLILAALVLFVIEYILVNTRYRILP